MNKVNHKNEKTTLVNFLWCPIVKLNDFHLSLRQYHANIVNAFQVDDKSTTVTKIIVVLVSFITLNILSLKSDFHLPKKIVLFASMRAL